MELDWLEMPIHQAIKADWKTPEILIEGSLNCAKTTVMLDKEVDAIFRYPGIPILLFRWSEDAVETKLRPAFEEVLSIRGVPAEWNAKQKRFTFENGSVVHMFGLKSVSMVELYNKIRGLGVSRVAGDQVEEVAQQVAAELRGRLRPNLTATVAGRAFPFQLTFVSNSEDDDFWLSKEFPIDNHIKGRRLFQLSVFDNKHLPRESLDSLLRQFPEDHPKHRTMVLGKRGPRVYGVPVFEGLYQKQDHWREIELNPSWPVLEAFECGKHNPVWIYGQRPPAGGLTILGGIMGLGLMLEDFWPLVQSYRRDWIPRAVPIKTCISSMGDSTGWHFTLANVLKDKAGITCDSRLEGNAPNVRLAMIENIAAYLRRRNYRGEEYFSISKADRFRIASKTEGERASPIVHHAFEGGYTWDEHFISIGHKEVRQPREDDKFANVMHAIENIELNYCAARETELQREAREFDEQRRSKERPPVSRSSGSFAGLI